MNDKVKLAISLTLATGIVGHTVLDALKIHRQEKAKREQIKIDQQLDLQAIRRAGDHFTEELKAGVYDHLGFDEMLNVLYNQIEFERIIVRFDQD